MTLESQKTITVGIPIFNEVTLLDVTGATQVFAWAEGLKVIWLAETLDPVLTSEGVSINPQHTFEDHPDIDILFVPGGSGEGIKNAMQGPIFQGFIKKTAHDAEWAGSVCVGAFIVAAAGIFDGCRATTYWSLLDALDLFPTIEVDTQNYPRYLIDKKKKRFSGGGVSSSVDLALMLVKVIRGKPAAQRSDLMIQYAPDPPVKSGDPTQASPSLVSYVEKIQQKKFIQPITASTEKVLGAQG